jgi:hypothetical protein
MAALALRVRRVPRAWALVFPACSVAAAAAASSVVLVPAGVERPALRRAGAAARAALAAGQAVAESLTTMTVARRRREADAGAFRRRTMKTMRGLQAGAADIGIEPPRDARRDARRTPREH